MIDLQKTFSSSMHKKNVSDVPCIAEHDFISNVSQGQATSRESTSVKTKAIFSRQLKIHFKMYPLSIIRKIIIFFCKHGSEIIK